MDTRFVLVAGSLALVGVIAIGMAGIPQSPSVFSAVNSEEPQTYTESGKIDSADVRDPGTYREMGAAMFGRPSPPESVPAPAQAPAPAPQTPTVEAPRPDLFANYVYTGTVTIGEEKQALLENQRTKEGWYLHQGDPFMGATIARIEDNAITLNVHGKMRRIPKSDVYNLVPFDAQAGSSPDRNATNPRGPNGEVINGRAINGAMTMGSLSSNGVEGFYQSRLNAAKGELDNAAAQKYNTLSTLSNDVSVSFEKVPINTSVSIITSDAVAPNAPPAQVEFTVDITKDDIKL